jgi:beta-lactamase superfamily II metal-dependent hydrolase
MGVTYLDMLVSTNFDEDHMSGYADLQSRGIAIGCILANPTVAPETILKLKTEDGMGKGIEALAATLAMRRQMGWAQTPPLIPNTHMIWTWNQYPYFDDENNLSLVFRIDIFGVRFMFPGDLERRGWANLLDTCPQFRPVVAGVSVLIAAHHGRENGISEKMFSEFGCSPNLVVISDDYKQYETQETTTYYGNVARGLFNFRGSLGIRKVLTTRRDGEIKFSFLNGRCNTW